MKRWVAFAIDGLCVVAFVVLGTRSHGEGLSEIVPVAGPFAVGLAASSTAARSVGRPAEGMASGVIVWVGTIAVGMLLRSAFGGGTAPAFVAVTTVFLGVTLLGWRTVATRRARWGTRLAS